MTTIEQLMLKLGIDSSAVSRGLRSLKSQVSSFVSETAVKFGAAFATYKVVGELSHVIEKFGEIKDRAENLDVSTDFFQGIGFAADTTNSSLEAVEKGLTKLANSVGKAKQGQKTYVDAFSQIGISMKDIEHSTVEEVFYRVADGMKATSSTAVKTSSAMDLLGRSGGELVTLLSQGSDKIKEMIEGTNKLSQSEIREIAKAKDSMKGFFNWIDVEIGKDLASFSEAYKSIKENGFLSIFQTKGGMSFSGYNEIRDNALDRAQQNAKRRAEMQEAQKKSVEDAKNALASYNKHLEDLKLKNGSTADKMSVLNKRWKEQDTLAANAFRSGDWSGFYEAQSKMADIENEIADTQKKADEDKKKADQERLDRADKLKKIERDIGDERRSQADLQKNRAFAPLSPYAPNLEELAQSGTWRKKRWGASRWVFDRGPFAGIAQNILDLEAGAKNDLVFGNVGGARQKANRIEQLKGILKAAGIISPEDSLKSIDDAVSKSQEHLSDLVEQRKKILIEPTNGA